MAASEVRLVNRSSSFGLKGKITHRWIYHIKSSANDDPYTVYKTAVPLGLPDAYEIHPLDPGSVVLNLDLEQVIENEASYWRATVDWGQLPEGDSRGDRFSNPLMRPTRWILGSSYEERLSFTHPADGKPILNVLDHVTLNGLQWTRTVPTLAAEKNFRTIGEVRLMQTNFLNTYNNAAWNGYPVGTLKCTSITTGGVQKEDDVEFYGVSFSFDADFENTATSHMRIDPVSFIAENADGDEVMHFDDFGNRIIQPVALKADGQIAGINDLPPQIDVRFNTSNFNLLQLGAIK